MIRLRTVLAIAAPVAIAGGLLLSSAPGHAEAGGDDTLGFWPAAADSTGASGGLVAQADPPRSRRMPIPPVPPAPPSTPSPPSPPSHSQSQRHKSGMSISIHDGKVQIGGIAELVEAQLERVLVVLDNLPDVPRDVRERVKGRVRAVRGKLTARLARLKSIDLDKLGPEIERMGDEFEKEMEGLDKDLAQLGERFGEQFGEKFSRDLAAKLAKDFAKSFKGYPFSDDDDDDSEDDDDDDDDDDSAVASLAVPPSDIPADVLGNLKNNLTLDRAQKEELARLRAESERKIAAAQRELEDMSQRLHVTLEDASASEADIARQIDMISAKEATIRKARVLTWVKVRSLLRKDQRKQVEAVKRPR